MCGEGCREGATHGAPDLEGNGKSLCSLDQILPGQKQRLELRPGPSLELDLKLALTVLLPQPCLI